MGAASERGIVQVGDVSSPSERRKCVVMTGLTGSGHQPSGPASGLEHSGSPWTAGQLDWAQARIVRKRKLRADAVAYAGINMFLIGSWAVTGFGYFWPGWVLAGWGVLLLLDAWNVQYRRPITDEDLDRELRGRR